MMRAFYRVYQPNVDRLPDDVAVEFKGNEPTYDELNALIVPLIGGGDLEHVSVLFDKERRDMFVDAEGSYATEKRPALPYNHAATEIYHAASKERGVSTKDAPLIYGPAVLFDRRVWF